VVIIAADNVFVRDEVTNRFAGILAEALSAELGRPVEIEVVIAAQ